MSAARAVVVWQREQAIEAAIRNTGGAWQPAVEVSESESREPALGMDADGNAIALWSSGPELSLRNAEVASLPLGGAWTEAITIAERLSAEGAQPQIAVDPVGQAMAVWTAWDGTARTVEAASGAVNGRWGSPVTILPPGSWSHRAQVAMDSTGNAAAVWRAAEPLTMQGAFFELNPPVTATDAAGHSTTSSATVNVTRALAVSGRVVRVRKGRARLKLHCPGTTVCRGSVALSRQVKSRKGRRVRRVIGQTRVAIPGGAQMTVNIKLKRKSVKLRARGRKRGLRAQITGDAVEPRTVVLKPFSHQLRRSRAHGGHRSKPTSYSPRQPKRQRP